MVADAPRDDSDGGDAVASASDGRACARAPWAGLVDFTARLERVFGWQLLAAMVSADFFIKGVVKHMISTTSLPYAQRYLKFSAQAFQRFEVLVSFPWMLKPLLGLITDTTPLFGYRKRVYLTLFALAGTVSMVIIAKKKFGPPDAEEYAAYVLMMNLLIAGGECLVGSRVFEAMSTKQHLGADLMTWDWSIVTVGSMVGTLLAYFGLHVKNYRMIFWMATPCAAQFIFTSAFGLLPEERVGSDFNAHALAKKHKNLFAVAITVSLCSLGVIGMQLVDAMESDLILCVVCCLCILGGLTGAIHALLDRKTASLIVYVIIERFLCVNVKQAKMYWYTEDESCVPGGPHFDYVFYSVVTFMFALVAQAIGIWMFQRYLSRSKVRLTFLVATLTKVVAKAADIWIIMRWNIRMGVDDRSAFVLSEGIIEGIAFVFTYLPAATVLAKVVDKNVECTVFTILAGSVNVGKALALTLGSASMTFVGIHTDLVRGECNFDRFVPLLVISGLIIPLLSIPLIYLLIPDWDMHDDMSEKTIDESIEASAEKK